MCTTDQPHLIAAVVEPVDLTPTRTAPGSAAGKHNPLAELLTVHHAAAVPVARRPLTDYGSLAHTTNQRITEDTDTTTTLTGGN